MPSFSPPSVRNWLREPVAISYNRSVQSDVDAIIERYREEATAEVADAFFDVLITAIEKAHSAPKHHHFAEPPIRRINLDRFPYNILYKEVILGIRVLVVRHNKRRPSYGTRRR